MRPPPPSTALRTPSYPWIQGLGRLPWGALSDSPELGHRLFGPSTSFGAIVQIRERWLFLQSFRRCLPGTPLSHGGGLPRLRSPLPGTLHAQGPRAEAWAPGSPACGLRASFLHRCLLSSRAGAGFLPRDQGRAPSPQGREVHPHPPRRGWVGLGHSRCLLSKPAAVPAGSRAGRGGTCPPPPMPSPCSSGEGQLAPLAPPVRTGEGLPAGGRGGGREDPTTALRRVFSVKGKEDPSPQC